MKAEIGYDEDRGYYLCVTPASATESAMLQHVAKDLGFETAPWIPEAKLYRRAMPVVVKSEDCDIGSPSRPIP